MFSGDDHGESNGHGIGNSGDGNGDGDGETHDDCINSTLKQHPWKLLPAREHCALTSGGCGMP
jgi:hypothetical protein